VVAIEPLVLNPTLDPEAFQSVLADRGRVHIPELLEPKAAVALHRSVVEETPWRRTQILAGGERVSFHLNAFNAQPAAWRAEVEKGVLERAAHDFQYVFDNYNVAEEIEAGRRLGLGSDAIYDFINGAPFLDFLRRLTGDERVAYCDAQITRYTAGQFLREHDDDLEGRNRLYAYVLGLTPEWKPDWGGLLLFLDAKGDVVQGFAPRFNALNLFKVPAQHCVSAVSSFCPAARYSITGWVRSSPPGLPAP
jgi:Rps23 Pro-64 3,4-dihydroxylase Tpa1-like proline 4-hydroxylase